MGNNENTKAQHVAVSDTAPTQSREQIESIVEDIVTTAIARGASPSDAMQAMTEATMTMAVAMHVELKQLSAYILRAAEESPPTAVDIDDARTFIRECFERAQRIKATSLEVRGAVEQMRQQRASDGLCANCGRGRIDHSASNAAKAGACGEFVSWSPSQAGGQ